jgi:hypothetical protein
MNATVRRLRAVLRPRTAISTAAAAITALRVERLLRTRELPETCRALGISFLEDTARDEAWRLPAWAYTRSEDALRVVRRWPWGDTCLRRALVIGHRIRSLEPTLVVGVQGDRDGEVRAHAWLRIHGHDLDPESAAYAPFAFT